jgi:hypothetical protein
MKQCKQLTTYLLTTNQKLNMINTVICAGIAYSFYAVHYSMPTITKLEKKIIALYKKIHALPTCTLNIATQLLHNLFGMEAFSIKNAYLRYIGEQLLHALNDTRRLEKIYNGLTNYILAKYGGALHIPRLKHQDCIRSLITRTLYLLKTVTRIHLQTIIPNFLLSAIPLETMWLLAIIQFSHITQQYFLKLL